MSDIRTLLHDAAVLPDTDTFTTEAAADADLVRARRALRRRRAGRTTAASGLLAAAALGAFMVIGPGQAPSTPPGDATAAAPRSTTSSVELVAYTGAQPTGYTLDTVPVGWTIRDDTRGLLTLAPKGAATAENVPGTTSLEGTIAVMTESDTGVPTGVRLDPVRVGDRPGVIAHMLGSGDTRTLFLKQPSGTYLVIQVWDGLGWDNDRIAEFADSVHITKDAQNSVG
jgi:hypothetical protein